MIVSGTDLLLTWAARGISAGLPLAKFALDPARIFRQRLGAMRVEVEARAAHVAETIEYMHCFPVRMGGPRERDDVARITARAFPNETREIFVALAKTPKRMRLLYAVGSLTSVEIDVSYVREWLREHEATAAWCAHNHIRLPGDDGDAPLDEPSEYDERLDRLLRRIAPIRDTMVFDTSSCTRGDEIRFWSYREGRFCSCSRARATDDVVTDDDRLARAARSRRRS